jgi:hypothetical protein
MEDIRDLRGSQVGPDRLPRVEPGPPPRQSPASDAIHNLAQRLARGNVEEIAEIIEAGVPGVSPYLAGRAAVAAVDGLVECFELARVLVTIAEGRRLPRNCPGRIANPGGYFNVSMQKFGIPGIAPRPRPPT